jgi:hypothetical protein
MAAAKRSKSIPDSSAVQLVDYSPYRLDYTGSAEMKIRLTNRKKKLRAAKR